MCWRKRSTDHVKIVIVLVFGLPESPRYLYKHGRSEEALAILCDVYDGTPDDPKIAKENAEILEALKVEQEHGEYKWSQLLKKDKVQTGRRVLLAYGMQFMNQMGGINLVVYYITSVLQLNVGLSRDLSLLLGGVINLMYVRQNTYRRENCTLTSPQVLHRLALPHILPRPHRQTQAYDVGILWPRPLHDADRHSAEFPAPWRRPGKIHGFGLGYILLYRGYPMEYFLGTS